MFHAVNQAETIGWLLRTLDAKEPFAAVTGDVGVGKSVVAAAGARRLAEHGYLVVEWVPPFAGPLELQKLLAEGLGLHAGPQTTPALLAAALRDRAAPAGTPVALLIDGAERLPPTILRYLWLMHRLGNVRSTCLQVVLFGRFTLWDQFDGPELAELRATIGARCVVLPLPADEALGYVKHRLAAAGAIEPVRIPRRLAEDVVVLGQGLPARLDAIATAVVAQEPFSRRVTLRGVQAAAAGLAGPAAMLPRPARFPGRRMLAAGGFAAAVAVAAGSLLVARPALTARLAAVHPTVAPSPDPHPTVPAQPQTKPDLVRPVMLPAAPPSEPARPPPGQVVPASLREPVPVGRPKLALPDAATLRVSLQYWPADPATAARAGVVAADLRERGHVVADPIAATGVPRATTVEYYFAEDRDRAEQIARDLHGSAALGHVAAQPNPPPPGSMRLVLANYAVTVTR